MEKEKMSDPRYPSLYQINTRVWLTELSRALGTHATLDDITDAELDRLAELGFDWIWFLSVWQTGPAAQQVSRSNRRMVQGVCTKRCRISKKKTSAAPASPFKITPCIAISAAPPRSHVCASGCNNAD